MYPRFHNMEFGTDMDKPWLFRVRILQIRPRKTPAHNLSVAANWCTIKKQSLVFLPSSNHQHHNVFDSSKSLQEVKHCTKISLRVATRQSASKLILLSQSCSSSMCKVYHNYCKSNHLSPLTAVGSGIVICSSHIIYVLHQLGTEYALTLFSLPAKQSCWHFTTFSMWDQFHCQHSFHWLFIACGESKVCDWPAYWNCPCLYISVACIVESVVR